MRPPAQMGTGGRCVSLPPLHPSGRSAAAVSWKSFEICVEEAASRNYKIKQAREEATRNATPLPPSRRPGGKKFSFDHDYYTIGHESDSIVKSVGMTDIEDAYNESLNVSSWN